LKKWRDDYKKFTDLSPSKLKLVQIIKVLNKYDIIRQVRRGANTPVYRIEINNPYHPDYKPAKIKEPEVTYKTINTKAKSSSKAMTPKLLQSEGEELDKEYEDILKNSIERNKNGNA